jgi:hypothetical protein
MHKMSLPDFLKWAFGEELAHVATENGGGGWSMIASFAALGTVIDTSGIGGAGLPELADVHPDAIAASEAVMGLAAERFELPEGWAPFPDLDDPHGLIGDVVRGVLDERALRYAGDLNQNLIALVIASAVLGKAPDWSAEQPKFQLALRAGKPAWFVMDEQADAFGRVYRFETDGFNAKAGKPKRGAYRKYEMDPAFASTVRARIDWYLWALAMESLARRLGAGLKAHRIAPFAIDREPWREKADFRVSGQALEKAVE